MAPIFSSIAVAVVALIHIYILNLEMFLWATPKGRAAFKMTKEYAASTKVLAANQGLYNGFLSAGLVWGLLHPNADFKPQIQLFFLGCVAVAGAYGAATVSSRILIIQAVPATVGIGAILLGF